VAIVTIMLLKKNWQNEDWLVMLVCIGLAGIAGASALYILVVPWLTGSQAERRSAENRPDAP
jgi:hypothetical protein